MPTRYQVLRETIARLAAPAEAQAGYIRHLFRRLDAQPAGGLSVDELALEFSDSYIAVRHMRDFDEITQEEIDAAKPLDDLLETWSGSAYADFWTVDALYSDPRWEDVRICAKAVLERYPDEIRESDWTRGLRRGLQAGVDE